MPSDVLKIVGKYAMLLTVFYGIEFLIIHGFDYIKLNLRDYFLYSIIIGLSGYVGFILNIIVAALIYYDKRRLGVEGRYAVLLTIFFRPIGVVLFFVYVLSGDLKKQSVQNNES